MVHQQYISSNNSSIFLLERSLKHNDKTPIIILFPGFSQSGTDRDYLFSQISYECNQNGFGTVQVDPYGHGDSYGHIEHLKWNDIIENIKSVANYIHSRYSRKLYIICRGVYCNAFFNSEIQEIFDLFICINPVYITKDYVNKILVNYDECIEVSDYILYEPILRDLLIAMGAEQNNICGQKIEKNFLIDALTCEESNLPKQNIKYIYYEAESDIFFESDKKIVSYSIKQQAQNAFKTSIVWRHKLIDILLNLIKSESDCDKSTISN